VGPHRRTFLIAPLAAPTGSVNVNVETLSESRGFGASSFSFGHPAGLHFAVECSKLALSRRHWDALEQLTFAVLK
jgi:hypothetical protein